MIPGIRHRALEVYYYYYRQPCVATQPIMFYVGLFYYRQPCVATQPIMFCYGLFIFIFLLFTVRSQKLPNRFSQNFQELCILV